MNLQEFQLQSKRTMPYNGEPSNQVEFENMLGNYAMGLIGETVELMQEMANFKRDEILKELGDVSHYAIGLATILKIDVNKPYNYIVLADDDLVFDLLISASRISEVTKKHLYHRHEWEDVTHEIHYIFDCLYTLAMSYDCQDYWEVLQMNIDKLKTRYPEKFSTEDSIARVDVSE